MRQYAPVKAEFEHEGAYAKATLRKLTPRTAREPALKEIG